MARIQVDHLTFYYEGNYEGLFSDASFTIDADWRLGFMGGNRRGKTIFLNLLMGKYRYRGGISTLIHFEYFPFQIKDKSRMTINIVEEIDPDYELWKLLREINLMEVEPELFYRPYDTLSNGERTGIMLAVLSTEEHNFLLIDEPTSHLDAEARQAVSRYLNKKSGFILVSHDHRFTDRCVDHMPSLNKSTIGMMQGSFTTWWDSKRQRDKWETQESEKLGKEIGRLRVSARQTECWSDAVEKARRGAKTGGLKPGRGYVEHKAARMVERSRSMESRMEKAAEDKEKLLKDVETAESLKIIPLRHHKQVLVSMGDVSLRYTLEKGPILEHLTMEIREGNRAIPDGRNGSGKSTVIEATAGRDEDPLVLSGRIHTASGLVISYVSQDTFWLSGSVSRFTEQYGLDTTLFQVTLGKLDFSKDHFSREMQFYSEGQKRKVLLAKNLCERAHLYIWDEPLNFIDIFSRIQIKELIIGHELTMIFVEHDQASGEKVATKGIGLNDMA